jgi:hypothetical protein
MWSARAQRLTLCIRRSRSATGRSMPAKSMTTRHPVDPGIGQTGRRMNRTPTSSAPEAVQSSRQSWPNMRNAAANVRTDGRAPAFVARSETSMVIPARGGHRCVRRGADARRGQRRTAGLIPDWLKVSAPLNLRRRASTRRGAFPGCGACERVSSFRCQSRSARPGCSSRCYDGPRRGARHGRRVRDEPALGCSRARSVPRLLGRSVRSRRARWLRLVPPAG